MLIPMSWLRDYVDLPVVGSREVAERLTAAGLQVERVDRLGEGIVGVVVAKVLSIEELTEFKKPIRWVTLTEGANERQVICGATNFAVGDAVAYARPPAVLPGDFRIEAREAYGHTSDGMICSGRELGISDDHSGILVLDDSLELGTDVVDALGLRDDVLDISINPDRGYALSVRGVAREVAIAYSVEFRDPALVEVGAASRAGYDIRIDAPDGCDRYLAVSLDGLDPAVSSPAWLQRRLVLCGMRPISLMVDVSNYVMLAVGQPTHAFDRAKLRGPIVVRRAAVGERLRTLDGVDRDLDPRDLLIADDSGPIALAGVMGGESTEISDSTRDVLLESAHFEPTTVAYTARRHRLGSEASRRFERGVDHALAPAAAELAVALIAELGAASRTGAVTDVDQRVAAERIVISAALPGRIAGVDYATETVIARLTEVGCDVEADGDALSVAPPSWRPDLRIPVDLVEEVVRLEGYAALPSTRPRALAGAGLTRRQRLRRVVSRTLAAAGYVEVLCSPFVGAETAEQLMLAEGDGRIPSVMLANPVSDAEPFLRTTLLPGLLAALARNVGRGLTDVALFETGPVFRARESGAAPELPVGLRPDEASLAALDAALPDQPGRVAVVLAGHRELPGWWGPGRPELWADAIQAARALADALGITVDVAADPHAPFHPGRSAALRAGGVLLGHAGELHPRVVEAFGLPPRTSAAELSLDLLLEHAQPVGAAPEVSSYPAATIDIAVTVASDVASAELEAALRRGAGDLLEEIRLFDVYAGEQVGAGRKSMAFALRLRAPDRTLTAEEAAAVRDAAVAAAAASVGAELRA
ncbi:MAG TPA: phenylalanine--tRNA ligase subunit beta [Mycobacteriales bacterium]|nr:phenylalanine--tRNA ligase subunit beta [Mycobacteriales bacterium]